MKNEVLNYFKKISSYPRPSGHEEKIADYLVEFAKENNLEYYRDETNNIIIKKPSNIPGNNKTLIIQSHTDMVCEKNDRTDFDFLTQGLNLKIDGDYIYADGTTLGADNGVGVAMILALLTDPEVEHPNLEAVLTSSEETTMIGATKLDYSKLKGKHLLSLDGTEEGSVEVSSAGFLELYCELPVAFIENTLPCFEIKLTGLMGGHSGEQINTKRLNAIKTLVSAISILGDFRICNIKCNSKINAIPRETTVVIATSESSTKIKEVLNSYKISNNDFEKDMEFIVTPTESSTSLNEENTKQIVDFINEYPNGVLEYDTTNPNFPITSCNIANINIVDKKVEINISLRSSKKASEKLYSQQIMKLADKYNIKNEVVAINPFFERKENPYLINICANTYAKLYEKHAKVKGVHAGLEGGIFSQNIPDVEICTISSNIYNPHSPMEKASISSIDRVYEWIKEILKSF